MLTAFENTPPLTLHIRQEEFLTTSPKVSISPKTAMPNNKEAPHEAKNPQPGNT
ncbi:MAG: hypothetical protein R3A45_09015 [Bdellovibrionota bacterium]